ncbi:MAG TPA: hypothetical protein VHB98_20000 [Chloroflexota bacterium]|nr:hypothetical protein [Chloroflexota bacterium]
MIKRFIGTVAALAMLGTGALSANLINPSGAHPVSAGSLAGQPQIPSLQVCNQSFATGGALVKIASRSGGPYTGSFVVRIQVGCDPAGSGYPVGALNITSLSMNDSLVQGTIVATTFEQVTSTGTATPTFFANGRCSVPQGATTAPINGCHYWLMIADNGKVNTAGVVGTPEVVSFLVFNGLGQRIAYGTGPVAAGHITVTPTSN